MYDVHNTVQCNAFSIMLSLPFSRAWPVCYQTPLLSRSLNLSHFPIPDFAPFYLLHTHTRHPFLFACLSHCVDSFSGWVGSARATERETDREGELWEGNRRHVGVLVECWTLASICHFLTPSLALTGQGSGSRWRMTNLPLVMNETPPCECQEGADGDGDCLTGKHRGIIRWMVWRQGIPCFVPKCSCNL